MAIPSSKAELLVAIEGRFEKLRADLARVPDDRSREPSMAGHSKGTRMSPADLVAYLVGWNALVLKWLDKDDRGEAVDFPETGFKWNELGLLAQKFYADEKDTGWNDLLTKLEAGKAALVATIQDRPEDELYARPWHGKWTKGRMIQFNTASPYTNARARLRRWLKGGTYSS